MDKKYEHQRAEKQNSQKWVDKKFFSTHTTSLEPFSVLLPPPNITGKLHLGHAWDNYIQDTIIRYKKLHNFDVLWVPGMDHASIATQAKVEQVLQEQGISKHDLGRKQFLAKTWEWKDEHARHIENQWHKMGLALDYTRSRFTMDESVSKAVTRVFVKMHEDKLVYRGVRPVYWDPKLKTVLSNTEVENTDTKQHMCYLKYKVQNSSSSISVATTRPETLFSDVAVAVNPGDPRMRFFVGKAVVHPLTKKVIPVVASNLIETGKGTGAMKVSAHATVDFEIIKANDLEVNECIDKNGNMNDLAGKYAGLNRFEARQIITKQLEKTKVIYKKEEVVSSVGVSQRTREVVEVLVQPQWFVKMDKLAKMVTDNLKSNNKVVFYPSRFGKLLDHWLTNVEDWCVSRQLWWGHKIPAWYQGDQVQVQERSPGPGWKQEEDVLDTWFSSALAPFVFLGWPQKTPDLDRFFPTSLLVTGYDIIFLWVARMYFQSLYFTNQIPFQEVFIHGLIRDSDGQKMSKSLGNGIDPMEVINTYGSDALRWFLLTNSTPGQDIRYSEEKVQAAWRLCNKLWNSARFIVEILPAGDDTSEKQLTLADKWISNKLRQLQKEIDKNIQKYEFTIIAKNIKRFIETDFSSWYIEFLKASPNKTFAKTLLQHLLVIIHPFLPNISDQLYHATTKGELLNQTTPSEVKCFSTDNQFESVIQMVSKIREFREQHALSKKEKIFFWPSTSLSKEVLEVTKRLANAHLQENRDAFLQVNDNLSICIKISPTQKANEKNRLQKQKEFLLLEIQRCENILQNPNFVAKAPKTKIREEKRKLDKFRKEIVQVQQKLKGF